MNTIARECPDCKGDGHRMEDQVDLESVVPCATCNGYGHLLEEVALIQTLQEKVESCQQLAREYANQPYVKSSNKCPVCSTHCATFMVKPSLYDEVMQGASGKICWTCFEAKLGRALTLDDLSVTDANFPYFQGALMALRGSLNA